MNDPCWFEPIKPTTTVFKGKHEAEFTLFRYEQFNDFLFYDDSSEKDLVTCWPALLIGGRANEPVRYEITIISYSKSNVIRFHRPSGGIGVFDCKPAATNSQFHYGLRIINGSHSGIICPANGEEEFIFDDDIDRKMARNCIIGVVNSAARALYSTCQELDWHMRCTDSLFSIFAQNDKTNWGRPMIERGVDLSLIIRDAIRKQRKRSKRSPLSPKLRRSILQRDGYQCVDCGRSPQNDSSCVLHIDHRIAKARGGSDHPSNLQTLCDWCNLGKRTDADWKLAEKC